MTQPIKKAFHGTLDPRWWKDAYREQKKAVLEWFLMGKRETQKDLAIRLGVSRNTVHRWAHDPNMLDKVKKQIEVRSLQTKFRRVNTSSGLVDYYEAKIRQTLFDEQRALDEWKVEEEKWLVAGGAASGKKRPEKPDYSDRVAVLQKYMSAARREERTDLGETEQRIEHHVATAVLTSNSLDQPAVDVLSGVFGEEGEATRTVRVTERTMEVKVGGRRPPGPVPERDPLPGEVIDVAFREGVESKEDVNPVLSRLRDGLNNEDVLASFHAEHENE